MKNKQTIGMIAMAAISIIFVVSLQLKQEETKTLQIYDVFDTYSELTIVSGKNSDKILQKCNLYLHEKDDKWSVTKPDSEISALNSAAGKSAVVLSEDTIDILDKSINSSLDTNGFFDITVGALTKLWDIGGENPRVPTNEEITQAIHETGFGLLTVDKENKTAELSKPGASVTLGAIAKGYATQGILDILKKEKVTSALLNLGGNIYVMGKREDGSAWNVGVQDPLDSNKLIGTLKVYDTGITTSGGYQRYFEEDGICYHHIINPYTGMPANSGLLSVTVISDDPVLADVLSTACFVIGYKESIALIREEGAKAIFVTDDNTVYYSSELKDFFEYDNPSYEYKAID